MTECKTIDVLENRLNKIGTMVTRPAVKMFMRLSSAAASLAVSGD
jgi:hypothetical protein